MAPRAATTQQHLQRGNVDIAGLNYTIIHPGGLFDEEVRNVPAHCTFWPATHLSLKHMQPCATLQGMFHGCMCLQGGEREVVLGVDDQLLKKAETEGTSRRIPRDDVAALAVAALTSNSADNRY
jgi:hypothetical protein